MRVDIILYNPWTNTLKILNKILLHQRIKLKDAFLAQNFPIVIFSNMEYCGCLHG